LPLNLPDRAAEFAAGIVAGDRRAVARAITLVDSEAPEATLLEQLLRQHCGNASLIGVTGPPGAGKSTLVNALIGVWRQRGQRVAVLAVDPSSPI